MDEVELKNLRVVAVDGGTATGKGRLISELSSLLRLKGVPVIHLSTGSVYRAIAWCGMEVCRGRVRGRRGMSEEQVLQKSLEQLRELDENALLAIARERKIELHGGEVWIDGEPASIDGQLKAAGVGTGASIVSVHLSVRQFEYKLTRRQVNEFDGYVLIDGRDITNGVMPDAPLRLLLTVAPEVAARRSSEHTLEEIVARDEADRRKKYGALHHPDDPGENVIVLATDEHTPETARDHVYKLMRKVWPELPEL